MWLVTTLLNSPALNSGSFNNTVFLSFQQTFVELQLHTRSHAFSSLLTVVELQFTEHLLSALYLLSHLILTAAL